MKLIFDMLYYSDYKLYNSHFGNYPVPETKVHVLEDETFVTPQSAVFLSWYNVKWNGGSM